MQINLLDIDHDNFMVHPHEIAGEICYLVQPKAISAKWTHSTKIFRSSVWNAAGEPVSLSFPKFVNWGESPDVFPVPTSLKTCSLMEKLDGSTLIISYYKGTLITRTRGTVDASKIDNGYEIEYFKSEYPKAFAKETFEKFGEVSLLMEWVSPVNRIVIDYGAEPDIYLTGIVNHSDYSLFDQNQLDIVAPLIGVKRPKRYAFDSIKDMLTAVDAFNGVEGICLYSKGDQEIHKVKSAEYLAAHRMKSEVGSLDKVIDMWFTLKKPTYSEFENYFRTKFDFEIFSMCRGHVSLICEAWKEVLEIKAYMKQYADNLKHLSRKDAAQKILQAYGVTNRASFVFSYLDGKELSEEQDKKILYQVLKK